MSKLYQGILLLNLITVVKNRRRHRKTLLTANRLWRRLLPSWIRWEKSWKSFSRRLSPVVSLSLLAGHVQLAISRPGKKLQRFVPYEKYGNARGLARYDSSLRHEERKKHFFEIFQASTDPMGRVIWKVSQAPYKCRPILLLVPMICAVSFRTE